MAEIIIYTTQVCPYCVRAKSLLKQKGQSYKEIDVSNDEALRDDMTTKAGGIFSGTTSNVALPNTFL